MVMSVKGSIDYDELEKSENLGNFVFFLMRRRPPRSTQSRSSAASDVYKRQPGYYS